MTFSTADPFVGPVPPTVSLTRTPLTGVLVQVRFPEVLSIAKAEFIAEFQERIRTNYPLHHLDQNRILQVMSDDVRQGNTPNWRFIDEGRKWRLSLTTDFIALETRAYQSRSDFAQRTHAVVHALAETINPRMMTRIGIRYVDQLHRDQQEQLSRFIRPEILDLNVEDYGESLDRTQNEIAAKTDVGPMTSRWGFMPKNQTHEPDLMPPIPVPSWFLDVDVYNEFKQPIVFNADEIETRVVKLATRAYGFFRWAVNDDFLRKCGGNI